MRESVLSGAAAEQLCEHEDNEAGLEMNRAASRKQFPISQRFFTTPAVLSGMATAVKELFISDQSTGEIAGGSKLGIDATKKNPGEGFKRAWPPRIKMDEAAKPEVEKLFGGIANRGSNPE